MKNYLIILLIAFTSGTMFSQNRVTITDPKLEFSIEAPENWQKYDDGYLYYLFIPSEYGDEYISITYLETEETSQDENFKFSMNQIYPLNEPGYKLVEAGDDIVNCQPAKWVIFTSKFEGVDYKSILYRCLLSMAKYLRYEELQDLKILMLIYTNFGAQ